MRKSGNICAVMMYEAKYLLLPIFALVLLLPSATAQTRRAAASSADYSRVERTIRSEFLKDNRGGLTVGIVRDGKLVWTRSYGYADEQGRIRAVRETIYPIGSITKLFTGIMLLQLVERGKVHFTDPVEKYFPELKEIPSPYPWTPPITLMQLATMTSGLEANPPTPPNTDERWEKQVLAVLPKCAFDYEPGTRREYSNLGYLILAVALSRAAGQPYTQYIETEILKPLGMRDTHFSITPHISSRVAKGYYLAEPSTPASTPKDLDRDILFAAGGLLSTVDDLAKFVSFQMGYGPETVLSHRAIDDSYRLVVPSDGDLRYGDGVGFAAVRNPDASLVALGHGGLRRLAGVVTSYEFDRSTRTGVILLANTSYGHAQYKPMVRRLLSMLHPDSPGGTGLEATEEH